MWSYLTEVIEVVFAIDPAVRWPFVDAVGFVSNVSNVWSIAKIKLPFEKLKNILFIYFVNNKG